jgi:hypothetical protein
MVTSRPQAVRLVQDLLRLDDSRRLLAKTDRASFAAGLHELVRQRDTPALYGCLMETLSFQGISDQIAADYLARHGNADWQAIRRQLRTSKSLCPKLQSFDAYEDCGFQKLKASCNNPSLLPTCLVPRLPLRKGQLNQLALSLYLFIRDRCAGDLIGFMHQLISTAAREEGSDPIAAARQALLKEFSGIYGIGPKLAAMALSSLLMASRRTAWRKLGRSLVVVDSLVHNFLHRTGILAAFKCSHGYGSACYGEAGCAVVLYRLAAAIDLSAIEPKAPAYHPRLLQYVIWEFCAQIGRDICNGNHIDDHQACQRTDCPICKRCSRLVLKPPVRQPTKRRGSRKQLTIESAHPAALQQGSLDSLCGLYAVINAIRLAHRRYGGFRESWARALFAELVGVSEFEWGLANLITEGCDEDQFRTLLSQGLKLARQLTRRQYSQSFKAPSPVAVGRRGQLQELARLTTRSDTAVIVGIGGRIDHWSVLAQVSDARLVLYDSDRLSYLPLPRCSLAKSGKAGPSTLHRLRVSSVIRCRG